MGQVCFRGILGLFGVSCADPEQANRAGARQFVHGSSCRQGELAGLQVFTLVRFAGCCLLCFYWPLGFGVSLRNGFYSMENWAWYKCVEPNGALGKG